MPGCQGAEIGDRAVTLRETFLRACNRLTMVTMCLRPIFVLVPTIMMGPVAGVTVVRIAVGNLLRAIVCRPTKTVLVVLIAIVRAGCDRALDRAVAGSAIGIVLDCARNRSDITKKANTVKTILTTGMTPSLNLLLGLLGRHTGWTLEGQGCREIGPGG